MLMAQLCWSSSATCFDQYLYTQMRNCELAASIFLSNYLKEMGLSQQGVYVKSYRCIVVRPWVSL